MDSEANINEFVRFELSIKNEIFCKIKDKF